ncbi:M1 family metallopeptidase [Salisaeta longa]|uniref:M1 family metallopeptidase n=1 Tax=Salisaeta longa TaxID=503170 RepID=UPI0003B661EC|nr:M1 family metallopeptidase [Salisaeta longa]
MPHLKHSFWALALLLLPLTACGQPAPDSGGPLLPEQAAYDVTFYDLAVAVEPAQQTIAGTLRVTAAIQRPLASFVLNLDQRLTVRKAWQERPSEPLAYERRGPANNQLWITLPRVTRPGDTVQVAVAYGGAPRVAPNPPWNGGFTWQQTADGAPWVATANQSAGGDLWWPVKDHPSDEPDSMRIAVTVPAPLVAASNGVLQRVTTKRGRRTFHWRVTTPINTYGVALNIAPYARIDTTYRSVTGRSLPVSFYVLPARRAAAQRRLPSFLDHVRFLEETLGPYPFRTDKYGIAHTPFLGMEHQTIIAYGSDFEDGGLGYDTSFDALHFHELAHEWFGNLVTVADWKDMWLHEGFATYLEALYAERLNGAAGYQRAIRHFRSNVQNDAPIARLQPTSAQDIYSSDLYYKGAMILHTLRYVVGADTLRRILRRFAYPTATARTATGGQQCRHVTTADFVQIAEEVSGRQLDGFFMAYLYEAELPELDVERSGRTLRLRWQTPDDVPFHVPVPVAVNGTVRRVAMPDGRASLTLPAPTTNVRIDPNGALLYHSAE